MESGPQDTPVEGYVTEDNSRSDMRRLFPRVEGCDELETGYDRIVAKG